MARDPDPLTLSDLVRRAVEIVDPDGHDPAVAEFEQRFEDADEPVSGILDTIEERVEVGADEDPGVVMAQAIVVYLAHRRDEFDDEPEDILALAARAEFNGTPPEALAAWLADRGIRL
jgi:hypothetical protein